jgi:hypothetical protein
MERARVEVRPSSNCNGGGIKNCFDPFFLRLGWPKGFSMRASFPLALAVFSLGAMAPDGAASVAMGDVIPDTIPLHLIPKHETYRYAVVNGRGVIVDATSRQVVYVVR